ncbi:hypothetical protein AB0I52_25230 [Streptomyces sp. NPDC050423]|uniref:hypothetical protein n=1 Tax=Streptomyces sp. NPDC050423 TaxID=3155402 RepID=UPI003445F3B8
MTNLAYDGSANDGSICLRAVDLALRAPSWVDNPITGWSAYRLGVFALAMLVAWRQGHVALTAAGLIAASRVWVGGHYPHGVRLGARLKDGALCPLLAAA